MVKIETSLAWAGEFLDAGQAFNTSLESKTQLFGLIDWDAIWDNEEIHRRIRERLAKLPAVFVVLRNKLDQGAENGATSVKIPRGSIRMPEFGFGRFGHGGIIPSCLDWLPMIIASASPVNAALDGGPLASVSPSMSVAPSQSVAGKKGNTDGTQGVADFPQNRADFTQGVL